MNQLKNDEFNNVRLAIGDNNREVRLTLISQFNAFGFRNVLHTDNLKDIRVAVAKDSLDVIICDEAIDPKFSKFIYDVRHQTIGSNPFIIAIATVEDLTGDKVKALTDSGIDDVVVKPLSVGKLLERISLIARSRKPFVVTTDYIGPDRRKSAEPRPDSQVIPTLEVPNPLVYLREKKSSKLEISTAIANASETINEQKMERHAFQITYLVNKILPLYNKDQSDEIETVDIERITHVASDINHRLKKTRFSDAADLCDSMVDLSKKIRTSHPNPTDKDLELLPVLSQAIQLAFQSVDDGSVSVQDIIEKLKSQNVISKKKKKK